VWRSASIASDIDVSSPRTWTCVCDTRSRTRQSTSAVGRLTLALLSIASQDRPRPTRREAIAQPAKMSSHFASIPFYVYRSLPGDLAAASSRSPMRAIVGCAADWLVGELELVL
jgi:hypothetical protein